MLAQLIERETAEGFDLTNAVTIEVATASHRTTRGYAVVAALCDEIAHWHAKEHSASSDREIVAALRPGMATIPTAMLLAASSPNAARGVLFDAFRRHFGPDGDPTTLVWRAPHHGDESNGPAASNRRSNGAGPDQRRRRIYGRVP